jgi:hypothetical protein
MNHHQKAFLKTLDKSYEQAKQMRKTLKDAMTVGKMENDPECRAVIIILEQYLNAAKRTSVCINLSYDSEGSDAIGTRLAGEHYRNRGLLN